ncbi:MAG: helix-turn-helix domain-containing protein [Solobacterium sp.]|jgi:repressor LexA|nr:helix-turn-helix domain-containing protein [Solobacterium sp.]MBR3343768.1 helix-turn-helix domain-containing protein [Solobacterium sp.]HAE16187.1 LexA repressor [Erysipelotrichaceae bacterium]
MELKDLIKEYKERTGVNDSEIARRVGVTRSTASRWSSGQIRHVSSDVMERLSEMMGYNIEPLLKGMEISIRIPVLGFVKGGYDLFAEENYLGEEDASLDERKSGDYFLKVTGDSMKGDGIMDGSLVLVKQTDSVENGKIAVVMVGDEVTVKRVYVKDKVMILEASNPEVENRYFSGTEVRTLPVRVIGRVVLCRTYF